MLADCLLVHRLGSVFLSLLSLETDGTSGLPFGTQTGQRSGELTANYG